MQTLLRGGRVIDPGTGFDGVADVLVTDGVVSAVAAGLAAPPGCAVITVWPLPPGGTTHPRTAGTFAKTLRVMVRELVAGVPVVGAGELRTDAFPGQPLRGEPR
ncbi:hypothetical protein [Streptomyces sp. NPDC059479]|uniref:hypothetical protein n=1 Tax=Streptomyces sp. NPDC059479 TaxID=3346848 RepID=UPI0036CF1DDB